VALVLLLAAQLVREQRVAPGSVDDEARSPVDPRAVVELDLDRRTFAVERDRTDALAFERARALGGGVAKEQLVELGAAHLPRVGHRLVPRLDELDELAVLVVGRDELDPVLGHADRLDLLAHAEALEQRGVGRQERLADVKARVVRLLGDDDVAAGRGEQRGDRRARRPAADDEDVAATLLGACGRIGTGRQGLHGGRISSQLRLAAPPSLRGGVRADDDGILVNLSRSQPLRSREEIDGAALQVVHRPGDRDRAVRFELAQHAAAAADVGHRQRDARAEARSGRVADRARRRCFGSVAHRLDRDPRRRCSTPHERT
jgi:hypothetical protein